MFEFDNFIFKFLRFVKNIVDDIRLRKKKKKEEIL